MSLLILLRHGQSMWNQLNLFTGWIDVPLSREGIREAQRAAATLRGIDVDRVFTSALERSLQTAMLTLAEMDLPRVPYIVHEGDSKESLYTPPVEMQDQLIPVWRDEALNERHYGSLAGMDKDEARRRFGVEQVQRWRRSYDEAPPEGESLKLTAERATPYFKEKIMPALLDGETVLVVAHGNSLRSIVMHIENLSEQEVLELEIATGDPLLYQLGQGGQLFAVRQP